ncbi:MAG: glycerol uptake facilitator protein [Planctomycetota bacterium]
MHPLLAEFLGTAILILIGNGVVANVVLQRTKGHDSGWIVITAGWAMAVFVGVLCSAAASGAHLNPAVTLGLAMTGQFGWESVPGYMLAQVGGGAVGGALVFAVYRDHYAVTNDADAKLATFCTGPAIRSPSSNLITEVLGTFILVLAVLLTVGPTITLTAMSGGEMQGVVGLQTIGALPVAFVVLAIGLGLGGTTGYAINPARDLGPRLAHAILPIPGKRDSDWGYAPIPVIGPFVGGALAALMHTYFC